MDNNTTTRILDGGTQGLIALMFLGLSALARVVRIMYMQIQKENVRRLKQLEERVLFFESEERKRIETEIKRQQLEEEIAKLKKQNDNLLSKLSG